MAEVARRLAPEDVPALTAWLASQPVPAKGQPARRARKLPLECGSVEKKQIATAASAAQDRGAYLVAAGDCIACHTALGGAPFAGGRAIETPFGTVYSSNITPHAQTGIGGWTRDDFWRALHEGRSKDGRLLYPAFPYPNYTRVSRADADAMFAYLQSLPAVVQPNREHNLGFPFGTQAALAVWRGPRRFLVAEGTRVWSCAVDDFRQCERTELAELDVAKAAAFASETQLYTVSVDGSANRWDLGTFGNPVGSAVREGDAAVSVATDRAGVAIVFAVAPRVVVILADGRRISAPRNLGPVTRVHGGR
jgi:mono/diheme cytochrome c family protein